MRPFSSVDHISSKSEFTSVATSSNAAKRVYQSSDALATVIITSKLFGVFSELTIDVNDIGSVIIDSRRDSYSSGHSSDDIPRKNASRTMCNSSRDEHFAKRASVGRFALNALVKCISSGDIVVLSSRVVKGEYYV